MTGSRREAGSSDTQKHTHVDEVGVVLVNNTRLGRLLSHAAREVDVTDSGGVLHAHGDHDVGCELVVELLAVFADSEDVDRVPPTVLEVLLLSGDLCITTTSNENTQTKKKKKK